MMESGKVRNINEHSHEKETKVSIVDKFRKVLTKKAVEKPTKSLLEIYLEETLNFTEASILYPFQSAESTMRKARARHRPEGVKPVEPEQQQKESQQHPEKRFYFQEVLQATDTTVIFMHQNSVKLLGKIEEIHVDCSISCMSNDVTELHLVTILAMVKNQDYPIAFGLVQQKSFEAFSSFFQYLREKAPSSILPNNILTSCDPNLQDALKMTFPDATIKVMWFFYASSVVKFAKDNGILEEMNKNLYYLSSFKMLLAIPLIPANYIVPGLDALKKWMSEKSVNFDGLCEFIDRVWLVSDGAEKISIFNGLSHSINNYAQNFNRNLLQTRNVDGLTKEQLLEAIGKQAARAVSKLNKSKSVLVLKKSQKLQKTILETATHNWIKANIHLRRPIQFLQQVSHCIDEATISFLINYDLGDRKAESFTTSSPITMISIQMPNVSAISEPPPLIFYEKTPKLLRRSIVTSTEPPPLVPTSNNLCAFNHGRNA